MKTVTHSSVTRGETDLVNMTVQELGNVYLVSYHKDADFLYSDVS